MAGIVETGVFTISTVNTPILNIATYRFVPLDDLPALRQRLFDAAQAQDLKGTVLLAEEGLNLCLAGTPEGIKTWLAVLRSDARFSDLPTKDSWSESPPFKRCSLAGSLTSSSSAPTSDMFEGIRSRPEIFVLQIASMAGVPSVITS